MKLPRLDGWRVANSARLLLYLTLFVSGLAQGNILLNSSFESPQLAYPVSSQLNESGTSIGNWRTGLGSTRLQRNSAWTFSDGLQALELLGTVSCDGIFPSVGQTYQLSFDMTSNPRVFEGSAIDSLDVTIQGQNPSYPDLGLGSFAAPQVLSGGQLDWQTYTIIFTTIAPSSLRFSGHDLQDGFGPMIDNVQLELIPEPSIISFALVMAVIGTFRIVRPQP